MFYLKVTFRNQKEFMEGLNLLTEYGISIKDMEMGSVEDPSSRKKGSRARVYARKNSKLKLGAKSTDEGLTPRTLQIKKIVFRILRAHAVGYLSRSKLTDLVSKETGLPKPTISPQISQLIERNYLELA